MAKPLKAYACTEEDENTGGIYFAPDNIRARKAFSNEYHDGELGGLRVLRAPWADQFADTRNVPASAMIANGWHFECSHCGERIDSDRLMDRGLSEDDVVGTQWSHVFCNTEEEAAWNERQRQLRAVEQGAIDTLRGVVLKRFPGVEFVTGFGKEHAYAQRDGDGNITVKQAFVSFKFPGQKYGPATLRMDWDWRTKMGPIRPHFTCCTGDREAFEAWAKETRRG